MVGNNLSIECLVLEQWTEISRKRTSGPKSITADSFPHSCMLSENYMHLLPPHQKNWSGMMDASLLNWITNSQQMDHIRSSYLWIS